MPESPSLHKKLTMTDALCQPYALAAGDSVCPIVGAVLSMRTWTELRSSTLPASSLLQYSSVCAPSSEIDTEVPVWVAPPSSS